MKNLKKLLAVLLSVCMIAALAAPALADEAEDGVITGVHDELVVIPADGTTVKNATLNGGLKIAEEAKGMEITIENSTVAGTVTVAAEEATVVLDAETTVAAVSVEAPAIVEVACVVTGAVVVAETAVTADAAPVVTVAETATVASVSVEAPAVVEVAGTVTGAVVVAETAVTADATAVVSVAETATVASVSVEAPAVVAVAGTVTGAVTVAETAVTEDAAALVTVAETAKVETVSVEAAADVEVAGSVTNVTVAAEGAAVTVASTATVENVAVTEDAAGATVTVNGSVTNLTVDAEGTTLAGSGSIETLTANQDLEKDASLNVETTEGEGKVEETIKVEQPEVWHAKSYVLCRAPLSSYGATDTYTPEFGAGSKKLNGMVTANLSTSGTRIENLSNYGKVTSGKSGSTYSSFTLADVVDLGQAEQVCVVDIREASGQHMSVYTPNDGFYGFLMGASVVYKDGYVYWVQAVKNGTATPDASTYDLKQASAMTSLVPGDIITETSTAGAGGITNLQHYFETDEGKANDKLTDDEKNWPTSEDALKAIMAALEAKGQTAYLPIYVDANAGGELGTLSSSDNGKYYYNEDGTALSAGKWVTVVKGNTYTEGETTKVYEVPTTADALITAIAEGKVSIEDIYYMSATVESLKGGDEITTDGGTTLILDVGKDGTLTWKDSEGKTVSDDTPNVVSPTTTP